MHILGIDPGLQKTGFGVIEKNRNHLFYIASGTIKTNSKAVLAERLVTIFNGIDEIVKTYAPTESAIEKVFVNTNPQATLLLGQARGAALAALTFQRLKVAEYTALQIKKSVVGNGKAAKSQVGHMVARLLNLKTEPKADAADALACAICHAHFEGLGEARFGELKIKAGRFVSAPE